MKNLGENKIELQSLQALRMSSERRNKESVLVRLSKIIKDAKKIGLNLGGTTKRTLRPKSFGIGVLFLILKEKI